MSAKKLLVTAFVFIGGCSNPTPTEIDNLTTKDTTPFSSPTVTEREEDSDEVLDRDIDASPETMAKLGVLTWRVTTLAAAPRQRALAVAGLDGAGKTVASARITLDTTAELSTLRYDVLSPEPATLHVDFTGEVIESTDKLDENQTYQALLRDVATSLDGDSGVIPPDDEVVLDDQIDFEADALEPRTGAVETQAHVDRRITRIRNNLHCFAKMASEAYQGNLNKVGNVCGLGFQKGASTNVMKVWEKLTPHRRDLIIAFAGTRITHIGDIARDLQSQVTVKHQNPLVIQDPNVGVPPFPVGKMGRGWSARWRNQALKKSGFGSIRNFLNAIGLADPNHHRAVRIHVTGHSLGAVVAELAGYDISEAMIRYQSANFQSINVGVEVVAFNPPKLAPDVGTYQEELWLRGALDVHQFSRGFDPVNPVPLRFAHPVWQTRLNNRTLGQAPSSIFEQHSGTCPMYYAPPVTKFNPVKILSNHSLARWGHDIDKMPVSHLECMYPFASDFIP